MIRSRPRSCSSTWKLRNNSDNVAAILNPTNPCKDRLIERMAISNNCYCSERPVRPKLCLRPKKCVFLDSDEELEEERYKMPETHVKKSVRHSDASSFDEIPVSNWKPPEYLQDDCKNYINQNKESNYQSTLLSRETTRKNNTKCSNYTFTNKTSNYLDEKVCDSEENILSDLKQLSTFRKDHYFETHSTKDIIKPIPEHTCVHKFTLDDRLLPQPLNGDAYGESRCIICDKPMNTIKLKKTDDRTINRSPELLPKFYKYGLIPKKIFMANQDNIKIEMSLDKLQGDYSSLSHCMGKRPEYFNTYALRYQKGVK